MYWREYREQLQWELLVSKICVVNQEESITFRVQYACSCVKQRHLGQLIRNICMWQEWERSTLFLAASLLLYRTGFFQHWRERRPEGCLDILSLDWELPPQPWAKYSRKYCSTDLGFYLFKLCYFGFSTIACFFSVLLNLILTNMQFLKL
jgi:hypothetical protein